MLMFGSEGGVKAEVVRRVKRFSLIRSLGNPFKKKTADDFANDYVSPHCRDEAWDCGVKSYLCTIGPYEPIMNEQCKWECGICALTPSWPDCPDVADDCMFRAEDCQETKDKKMRDKMTRECPHTCQRCNKIKQNKNRKPDPDDENAPPPKKGFLGGLKSLGSKIAGWFGFGGSSPSSPSSTAPQEGGTLPAGENAGAPGQAGVPGLDPSTMGQLLGNFGGGGGGTMGNIMNMFSAFAPLFGGRK